MLKVKGDKASDEIRPRRAFMYSSQKRRFLAFWTALLPSLLALYFLLQGLQKAEMEVLRFRPWGSGLGMIEITAGLGFFLLVALIAGRISTTALLPIFISSWLLNLSLFFSYDTWLWDLKATVGWSSFPSALTALTLGGLYSCWFNRLDSPYTLEEVQGEADPDWETENISSFEATPKTLPHQLDSEKPDPMPLPGKRKSWWMATVISLLSAAALLATIVFQASMVETDYNVLILQNTTAPVQTVLIMGAITFGSVFLTAAASVGATGPLLVSALVLMLPPLVLSVYDLFTLGSGLNQGALSAWSIMGPVAGILGAIAFILILTSVWSKHSPHAGKKTTR